jgi:16S rRNA (guanine527-N7)-methyltransferase
MINDTLPSVSRETESNFIKFEEHLIKWNKSLQLVQSDTLNDFQNRHINDSLQIFPFINGKRIVDIGSGAGFPGFILAMHDTSLNITLVDSSRKKHEFHKEIIHQLKLLNVTTICDRIENLDMSFDTVTSRALANLNFLLELSQFVSCETTRFVFLKGAQWNEEIIDAKKNWEFDVTVKNSLTSKEGKVLILEKVIKKEL